MELKFNISQLGLIHVYLFRNAEKCYEFLNEKNYIQKLKKMNQLGVIQNTSLKTTHTRMEYIILQTYLINLLLGRDYELNQSKDKKKKFNLGLSTDETINNYKVSGAELISIWILLFNSGHLIGTFAAEKGLLKNINENESLFNKFYNNMPLEIRDDFKSCIENNDVYNIHKFFIIFSLRVHYKQTKKPKTKNFINLLIKICQLYFTSQTERHVKFREYFNKIRQISYLFLDSQYSTSPINFKITSLLLNLDEYLKEILKNDSQFNKTLNSLDNLLNHDLYYSKEAFSEFNYYSDKVYNYWKKNIFTENEIKNNIISGSPLNLNKHEHYKCLNLFLELNDISRILIANKFNMDFENNINEILPKYCKVTIEHNHQFNFIIINLIFISENYRNIFILILKVIKEIITLKKSIYETEIKKFDRININPILNNLMNKSFSNIFKESILFILNNRIKSHYFIFDDKYDNVQVIAPHNQNDINLAFEAILKNDMDKFKRDEKLLIKSFSKKLFYKNSTMLVSVSSIKGYLKEKDELNVEIDGMILMYKQQKLHLYLIESKNQKKNAISTAKRDLSIKLDKLGLDDKLNDIEHHYKPKGIFYHLIL